MAELHDMEPETFVAQMVDIALRTPPLFAMDQILLYSLGLGSSLSIIETPVSAKSDSLHEDAETLSTNMTHEIENSSDLYKTFEKLYGGNPAMLVVPHLARFLVFLSLYTISFISFFLETKPLLNAYRTIIMVVCVPVSFFSSRIMVDAIKGKMLYQSNVEDLAKVLTFFSFETIHFLWAIGLNYLIQNVLAYLLMNMLPSETLHGRLQGLTQFIPVAMISPCLVAFLGLPPRVVMTCIFANTLLPGVVVGSICGRVFNRGVKETYRMYTDAVECVTNFGLYTFLESQWTRLKVPNVLRMFWLMRTLMVLLWHYSEMSLSFWWMYGMLKTLLIRGAETMISLLGMTSIISSISHAAGIIVQTIINSEDEEERSIASVSATLFFVLALQTGITNLEPEKRFNQICKNLCLLLTAILHFVHTMVQPVLHNISASRGNRRERHLRALGVCLFLCIFPMAIMYALWSHFAIGTWLLAVSAFCVEVIIKVLVTVTIYCLYMWDLYIQDGTWESLDDLVYYVRSFGNTVEFCFAVFLFCNGGWILLFESGGTIRAIMMLIHAYFNIWCEAKSGWNTFMRRRTAVAKINSLPDATPEEIENRRDVCAICYQEMNHAKMTPCNHLFHAICLRKWLNVQDTCPMCHEQMQWFQPDANADVANAAVADNQPNADEEAEAILLGSEDEAIEEAAVNVNVQGMIDMETAAIAEVETSEVRRVSLDGLPPISLADDLGLMEELTESFPDLELELDDLMHIDDNAEVDDREAIE